MKELIDKSAVIAEIDVIQDDTMDENRNFLSSYHEGIFDGLSKIENFLDTLETKEVDLEKEIDDYWNKLCDSEFGELIEKRDAKWFDDIAKYFYELGLKTQKEE